MATATGQNLDICGGTLILTPGQTIDVSSNPTTGRYVVPFIGELQADASGTVGVLKTQTVTITGIDEQFNLVLTEAQAVNILNAFKVEDEDASGGGFAEGTDASQARVKVTMDSTGANNFKDALRTAISSSDLSNNSLSLYNWLKAEARRDTVTLLSYDTLGDLLEASDLLTFDIAIDASQAAVSMHTKMSEGNTTDSVFQKRRNALFLQLPRTNVEAYLDVSDGVYSASEPVKAIGFLPLIKGDRLTLVFDSTVGTYSWNSGTAPSTGAVITPVDNQYNSAAGASLNTPAGTYNVVNGDQYATEAADLVFSKPTRRRVALTLRMTAGEGPFTVTCAGAKSPAIYNSTRDNTAKLTV